MITDHQLLVVVQPRLEERDVAERLPVHQLCAGLQPNPVEADAAKRLAAFAIT